MTACTIAWLFLAVAGADHYNIAADHLVLETHISRPTRPAAVMPAAVRPYIATDAPLVEVAYVPCGASELTMQPVRADGTEGQWTEPVIVTRGDLNRRRWAEVR